ncbi:MAG: hypothetical protein MUD14_16655 [Hydrococcus sp. Prado102]|jgi:hypothetical protein|nr:hypothetical protein [Hydrococcus sp. Prado102]
MSKKTKLPLSACPCCNPAINRLTQTFLSLRQSILLGTGGLVATIALSGQANANPDPVLVSPKNAIAKKTYFNAKANKATVARLIPNPVHIPILSA